MTPKWKKGLHCARVPKVSEGEADGVEDIDALLVLQRLQNTVRTSSSQFIARLRRSQLRQNVDATSTFLRRRRTQQARRGFEYLRVSTLLKRTNSISRRVVFPCEGHRNQVSDLAHCFTNGSSRRGNFFASGKS